jgi:uroporphyrinogen decarboxylase
MAKANSYHTRERVLTALSREVPDRVPIDLSWGFSPAFLAKFTEITGETDYEKYFHIDVRLVHFQETEQPSDYRRYFEGRPDPQHIHWNEWGIGLRKSQDSDFHFEQIESPLKHAQTVNEIIDYPFPDFMEKYRWIGLKEKMEKLRSEGLATCAPLAMTLFETAWQIRGFEEFVTDMMTGDEMAECLLDRLTDLRVEMARKYAEAGVDVLMLGDDVAMQTGMLISPQLWRIWLKPRMVRIINAAKSIHPRIHIFYHSDGNPSAIIDELIEIGVTVLNPIQPECMNPAEVKKKYGDRLAFWGTMGVQSTLPFGTPEDVRAEVKLRMQTIGSGGGFLLGPSHMIEPEVPWENIIAFFNAVEEYGYYR